MLEGQLGSGKVLCHIQVAWLIVQAINWSFLAAYHAAGNQHYRLRRMCFDQLWSQAV